MVTVGQISDALGTDIFSKNPATDFERKCLEREKGIKRYIDITGEITLQLVTKPGLSNRKLPYWKEKKIKSCLKNLCDYIDELYNELNKEKIERYCKELTPLSFFRSTFDPDIPLLMLNSYYGTIVSDIYWIKELTMDEAMRLSAGKLELAELGKRTPSKIKYINQFIKSNHRGFKAYQKHLDIIKEAFKCYDKKFYKAFNLLILTSVEGLTRQLGAYLIEKQQLDIDLYSETYNSLDSFLRKIPWKEDLSVSSTSLKFLTSHYERINYNDPLIKIPNPLEQIPITIKTRLDFLRRRFKENRDLILHGEETEYDKPFNAFINASAIYEVLNAIIECQNIYDKV